jgi:predicted Zn-dependent protease
MKHNLLVASATLAVALGLTACSYNPELGRSQLLLVNDSSLVSAAQEAWQQSLSTKHISSDPALNERVRRVGQRIVQAAGMGDRQWQYAVFDDPSANAFALPGAEIGVNTGLLKIAATDDQLAAVIGHEVGHVVAHHAAERMSQETAAQIGLGVAQSALGGAAGSRGQALASLGSAGAQLGFLLPYSRKHELEADRLGVDFMHAAGYDPRQAVTLWEKMQSQGGSGPPAFLSTHPSDAARIEALRAYIASRGWG